MKCMIILILVRMQKMIILLTALLRRLFIMFLGVFLSISRKFCIWQMNEKMVFLCWKRMPFGLLKTISILSLLGCGAISLLDFSCPTVLVMLNLEKRVLGTCGVSLERKSSSSGRAGPASSSIMSMSRILEKRRQTNILRRLGVFIIRMEM